MGYLQALNLLIKTYKATKGYLPKGIDMLKLKMKARQKVIDSKKVIEFPKERITNPFKPRPTKTEIMMKQTGIPVTVKGKTTTMTPDGILKMLMGKGKGKDVKIGQAPKTTKRKPTVDPKLTQEENIKRIDDQQSFKPPTPASNFLPDPQIANMFAQNVDPTTNLTRTETALLSPEEQLIRQRLRT